jgi:putative heme-binding domain-containing protein
MTYAARAADDPFAQFVRKTEPLTPAEEQKVFHLPKGFEIQLVASEPDIAKPMNLAFDSRGRLWVTTTKEYPFPAPAGKDPSDRIQILEDFAEDGHAKKISTFASGLDIPIGVYPYKDGALAYSIPSIWRFYDKDGDGKCDEKQPFYSAFGYKDDTHGMSSNYRRGYDGWVYGCHGFRNTSHVKGSDGQEIEMISGNTYRFKTDGSHIEIVSHGQVNPFGCTFDALGNMYTSDSHSKPNYQILRGGYYESFSPVDDGLGLAPMMMQHLHGSTAIASIMIYDADQFPAEFRGNTFVGNVITSRINRDTITHHGSSPIANEAPDFVSTDDPWFRPNQVILGPDGAMWMSDFYNRIIGHYEVPLDHPGRDRERGRIWRIVYKGDAAKAPAPVMPDYSKMTAQQLVDALGDHNLTNRFLIMNEITDRIGKDAIEPLKKMLASSKDALQIRHGMWDLFRLGGLEDSTLETLAKNEDAGVRVHAMRILEAMPQWKDVHTNLAIAGLKDSDPLVQRCAAAAMQFHPQIECIKPLLAFRATINPQDTHLLYVTRMSLREQFKPEGSLESLSKDQLSDADVLNIADVLLAVPTSGAANFLASHLNQLAAAKNNERLTKWVRHISQHVSPDHVDALVQVVQNNFKGNIDLQIELFHSLQQGFTQRGATLSEAMKSWGASLAHRAASDQEANEIQWQNRSLDGALGAESPWGIRELNSRDNQLAPFLDSIVGGERLTGVLRSKVFKLPQTLRFYLAGHDNPPDQPLAKKNSVCLKDAKTGKVLKRINVPRSDVAHLAKFEIKDHVGSDVYLEVVDGNDGPSYAWIAVGRFFPDVISVPASSLIDVQHRRLAAAELAGELKLTDMKPDLLRMLTDAEIEPSTRIAAAKALAVVAPDDFGSPASKLIVDPAQPMALRQELAKSLADSKTSVANDALIAAFKTAPKTLQTSLALAIANSPEGAEALLSAISAGKAPAMLLQEQSIKERLAATNVKDLDARIAQLTKGLTPTNQKVVKLIEERRAAFPKAVTDVAAGQKVFATNCMVCHSINNTGGKVGPNLDGVGNRGTDRLMEDVLDPNRNVDPAFRYSNVFTKDGDVVTGLFRREEGETLIFTNSLGKDVVVKKSDIQKRVESKSSLMPENFGEIIKPDDFNNLIAYLLSNRPTAQAAKTDTTQKPAQ